MLTGGNTLSVWEDSYLQLQPGSRHRSPYWIFHQRHQGHLNLFISIVNSHFILNKNYFFFFGPHWEQEFMKGGEELDDLIADLLEHAEREALLEIVTTRSQPESGQSADWLNMPLSPSKTMYSADIFNLLQKDKYFFKIKLVYNLCLPVFLIKLQHI